MPTHYSIGLTFPGTCEEAFTLYKSVFGVEPTQFIRMKDDPYTDATTAGRDKDKVAYVELRLGGILVTGDDTLDSANVRIVSGNNVGITIEPDNKEEADRVFKGLSQGATIVSVMQDYPWGYCGALVDRFGVKWGFFYRRLQRK